VARQTVTRRSHPGRQKWRLGILFFLVLTFPITMNYVSPILVLGAASEGTLSFGILFWSAFALLSLLLGRAMCGWVCPLGAFQEMKDRMAPKDLRPHRRLASLKYVLGAGWLIALVAMAAIGGGFTRVNLLYLTESGISVDSAQGWIVYGVIAGIVLLPAFFTGRRAFCRYLCPWSLLNTTGLVLKTRGRWSSLHLRAHPSACTKCGLCETSCPMTLPVREMVATGDMYHRECIYCGSCVDVCPHGVIDYRWGRPERHATN
jgi:ferredoxin-type protein NapH